MSAFRWKASKRANAFARSLPQSRPSASGQDRSFAKPSRTWRLVGVFPIADVRSGEAAMCAIDPLA